MSYAVWYSVFRPEPHSQFILPYSAQSPITREYRDFNTANDIWREIELIANNERKNRSLGQELWYLCSLFTNPIYIISDEYSRYISEFFYVTEYHIPMATSLNDTDAIMLECFTIIKNEMPIAINHLKERNGSKRKN